MLDEKLLGRLNPEEKVKGVAEADALTGDSVTENDMLADRVGVSELTGSSVDEALVLKKELGNVKDPDGAMVVLVQANDPERLKLALGVTEPEADVTSKELEGPVTEVV